MAIERKFIKTALDSLSVKRFLYRELERAGVSDIVIQKTPIATRITVFVRRPGLVVGKRGKALKDLCDILQQRYGIENPQFEVIEVRHPDLDPKLVAEKIGKRVETRPRFKPTMRMALREMMEAGAIGAEIRIAGKVVGKGGKAKTLTARAGYLKKSGHLKEQLVREGRYVAYLKAGAIGIKVKIIPPGTIFPDKVNVGALKADEPAVEAVAPKEEEKAVEPDKKEEQTETKETS